MIFFKSLEIIVQVVILSAYPNKHHHTQSLNILTHTCLQEIHEDKLIRQAPRSDRRPVSHCDILVGENFG